MIKRSMLDSVGQLLLMAILALGLFWGVRAYQTQLGQKMIENSPLSSVSFDEALKKSRTDGKPVLAVFGAPWCGACRTLERNVFTNPKVIQEVDTHFHFVRLDYESSADSNLFALYKISRFPTLLILNGSGDLSTPLNFTSNPEHFNNQLIAIRRM